ncbi:MAG: hypothetical protein JNK85_08980 [Verrucomicrobiales bacterium]|nr:hypothetical protein [Verrucomicrobiales bacterium]
MATLGILFAPAVCCFLIGAIWGNSSGLNAALVLVAIAVLGSLAAGICGGIRIARRFAGPNGTNVGVAIGLSLLCIGASAIACFGGCLTGLYSNR